MTWLTCIEYVGAKNGDQGYRAFWFEGRRIYAHRASYELFVGSIPEGLFVLHRCDNPPCVNPDHLFLGTKKDNYQDSFVKGRRPTHTGSTAFGHSCSEKCR